MSEQSAALSRQAIESVRRDPHRPVQEWYKALTWVEDEPEPIIPPAAFPSGRPLPDSLREWLAFDAGLLARHGWFGADSGLEPRNIAEIVADELGAEWGELYAPLAEQFPECFRLPGGSDSRRILAVVEPDSAGEYPILAVDVDDLPFVGVMYPGFDVYLAHLTGVFETPMKSYTELVDHSEYGPRMREHARRLFGAEPHREYPF